MKVTEQKFFLKIFGITRSPYDAKLTAKNITVLDLIVNNAVTK